MKIYLVRHAAAVPRSTENYEDSSRELTKKGKQSAKMLAKFIASYEGKIDLMITSDLVRARQTADAIEKKASIQRRMESANLSPEAEPSVFLNLVKWEKLKVKSIVIVGHEPFLGRLASLLVSGRDGDFFKLKKSGWIQLEWKKPYPIGSASVVEVVNPSLLKCKS